MATRKQTQAARKNIRKAREEWRTMTSRQRSAAQPEGRGRAKPGTSGEGEYYRIVVRPKEEFITFRYHDVGKAVHVQRLAGKRSSGSWATQAWLIGKEDAHTVDGSLVPDSDDARKVIEALGSKPKHVRGDIFEAKDRPNVPEKAKPTAAQRKARSTNIKKAHAARRRKTSRARSGRKSR